jgi:hypothetical protein
MDTTGAGPPGGVVAPIGSTTLAATYTSPPPPPPDSVNRKAASPRRTHTQNTIPANRLQYQPAQAAGWTLETAHSMQPPTCVGLHVGEQPLQDLLFGIDFRKGLGGVAAGGGWWWWCVESALGQTSALQAPGRAHQPGGPGGRRGGGARAQ